MSGIVNQTGAVSGIIGTTVGTPVDAAGRLYDTFSYQLEDAPNTSVGGIIASFDFTPLRNSTRQMYWYSLAGRPAVQTNHMYMEFDIYDNDNSAIKIDAQLLYGRGWASSNGSTNNNGISGHSSSTTTLTEDVSYKMRLVIAGSNTTYSGTTDTYGNDVCMSIICFE